MRKIKAVPNPKTEWGKVLSKLPVELKQILVVALSGGIKKHLGMEEPMMVGIKTTGLTESLINRMWTQMSVGNAKKSLSMPKDICPKMVHGTDVVEDEVYRPRFFFTRDCIDGCFVVELSESVLASVGYTLLGDVKRVTKMKYPIFEELMSAVVNGYDGESISNDIEVCEFITAVLSEWGIRMSDVHWR